MLTQSLLQKQTQKLIMTQDLRQSIELLPLSTQELSERIQNELIENPMLEEINILEKTKVPEVYSIAEIKKMEINESIKNSDVSWQETYSIDGPTFYDNEASNRNQKMIESSPLNIKLSEYLFSQLRLTNLTENELIIAEILISMIDEKGFINHNPLKLSQELNVSVITIKKLLYYIHRLDPIGIGARDVKNTLYIQSLILYKENKNLHKLIKYFFNDLERLDYKKISKQMKLTEEEIENLTKLIKKLIPFPASQYNYKKVDYVVPDVFIKETDGEFSIFINDEWIPKLKINKEYKKAIININNISEKEYLISKMNSAQWLIRSINQRRQTLFKVVNCIIDFQIDFFRLGISHVKPLTLKEIADKLNMHESTISRITTNKYIQTSWGVLELKWFFSSGVKSHSGIMESSKKIHDMIKNLIKDESDKDPFSDQDIVDIMEKQGIEIARRTVAKYRKILNILPANRRKRIKDLKN
jgi:RNA polymerase sigma-54 factor